MRDALFLLAVLGIAWAPALAALAWIWHTRRDLRRVAIHVTAHCNTLCRLEADVRAVRADLSIHDQRLLSLGRRLIAHEEGRPWVS